MKDENTLYWIWLSERCGIASKDFGKLMAKYDNPFDIYRLDDDEVEMLEGISPALKVRLTDKELESSYSILKYCKQKRVDIIGYSDKRYPSRLKNIEDPPVLLYVLGRLPDLDNRLCVGMVGTRKMSEYGRESAYRISYELSAANAVIVSGMALGVDGVSACGALASGGTTVAVLGCGISVIYPKEHKTLMDAISRHGAVITEYPPFERPNGYNFPKRNRIISGLCQGVLVVEGAVGSGALITAKLALSQGRELFALPGKINESNSDGPNELIKNGALVALSADDIIMHYDFLYHDCINYKGLRKSKNETVNTEAALKKYGVGGIYSKDTAYKQPSSPRAESENDGGKTNHIIKNAKSDIRFADTEKTEQKEEIKPDCSANLLESLDETTRKVFEAMPLDRAVTVDSLPIDGADIGQIITAFTLLEVSGLIQSLPGGMYLRK